MSNNIDYTSLKQLLIFRNLLDNSVIQKLVQLSDPDTDPLYFETAAELLLHAEELGLQGNLLQQYFLYLVITDENLFSLTAENRNGVIGSGLRRAAVHDIEYVNQLLSASQQMKTEKLTLLSDYHPTTPLTNGPLSTLMQQLLNQGCHQTAEQWVDQLAAYYAHYGCGMMSQYSVFRWQAGHGLVGIPCFDSLTLNDIIGYARQKQTLIENTEAFLDGKSANNILLVGARGTGKSSSIKALVKEYFDRGLRLVQVGKQDLSQLGTVMDILRQRGKYFIVFLDDLSFEDYEIEYKAVKSILDGGLEARPDNVIIYATSNRRHLIREQWKDRSDDPEEMHTSDALNEKMSLADRFGITLTFISPNQQQYLDMVHAIAKRQNLQIDPEELERQAIQWELSQKGRSGRTAQQFINYLAGHHN